MLLFATWLCIKFVLHIVAIFVYFFYTDKKIGGISMYYIIDTANKDEIEDALQMGVEGITANPSMYAKHQIALHSFLNTYANKGLPFLSGEVMEETYEGMLEEALKIIAIDTSITIKINFSKAGLRLANTLHKRGIKTAMTLVFTMAQCLAAINAHVDYIFFFIGRNEEQGNDGLRTIQAVQTLITEKRVSVRLVAASIKNLYQLEQLAAMAIDYAAIPYALYMKSLTHPLTVTGIRTFEEDWKKIA